MIATLPEYRKYLEVQFRGNWNMLDKQAIVESGLSKEVYFDILHHYHAYAMADKYREARIEVMHYFESLREDIEDTYNETHCYSY